MSQNQNLLQKAHLYNIERK